MCVCHHIDLYLDKMKEFHKIEVHLILSFIKPHKGVKTQTISRRILEILNLLGINTEVFTSDSIRSANTSNAKALGVTLNDIIEKGY